MGADLFGNYSYELYEYLLLEPLSEIYSAIDKKNLSSLDKYSFLLVDKFAIHSSSFFHLSKGIIEHRKSGETIKAHGYDLFTVNSTFRAIMETYVTFNHIYVKPDTFEEKEFKFLIWRIDGINEKLKYDIKESDFAEVKEILEADKEKTKQIIHEIEQSSFYRNNKSEELTKVYNPHKRKYCWRFLFEQEKIKPMTILSLIEYTCKTRGFVNSYRHASTHTHSSYLAIEEFQRYRSNPIPDYYTSPLMKLTIFITCMIISDICFINKDAQNAFLELPDVTKNLIIGIANSINNASH